jgi:hypothetical protein
MSQSNMVWSKPNGVLLPRKITGYCRLQRNQNLNTVILLKESTLQKSVQKWIQYSVSGLLCLHGSGAQTPTSQNSVQTLFGPVWRCGSLMCGMDLPVQALLIDSCPLTYSHFSPFQKSSSPAALLLLLTTLHPSHSSLAHGACLASKVSERVQADPKSPVTIYDVTNLNM